MELKNVMGDDIVKNKKFYVIFVLLLIGVLLSTGLYIQNSGEIIAFIPNADEGTISVIDVSKNELKDTLKVGKKVSDGIATTPDGKKLYTGNADEGQVLVYDIKTKELLKTIETGKNVHGIDITPDGKLLFVAGGNLELDDKFDYIQIVDTKADEVVRTLKSGGRSPSHVDFSRDSKIAYVSNVMSNDITIIDIEKDEIIGNIKVGAMPNELEPSPDGKFLYVANVQDASVSIVSLDEMMETARTPAGSGTHGIAVSGDGKYVWTANRFAQNVTVIDLEKDLLVKAIEIEGTPNHVSIEPTGKFIYVTSMDVDELIVINAKTYEIEKKIKLGKAPHEISFTKVK